MSYGRIAEAALSSETALQGLSDTQLVASPRERSNTMASSFTLHAQVSGMHVAKPRAQT